MVSGFVTSPDDQSRICLLDASPMRIASKSLMSIKLLLYVCGFGQRSCLFFGLLGRGRLRGDLDVGQVVERLVGRHGELAVLVDALLAFLDLLGGGLARRGAQRSRREVDPELLGGAEQLVVLLAHLDLLP